jgi:hypothetical protein
MVLSRQEREKLVLELYYNKGYTYRDISKELKMSPNQINDVIRRHEEKNNAVANKKKELSISSKAYKLFSKGKTNVEVAIMLDISQDQVTQFHLQYWKMIDQDKLVILHALLGDRIFSFFKLYKELIIKKEMSIEGIVKLVEIALDSLPYVEAHYEQVKQAADRQQERLDYLESRERTLQEEKSRMVTLPSSSYHVNDRETSSSSSELTSLPYSSSENYDPWSEYRNERKKSKLLGSKFS